MEDEKMCKITVPNEIKVNLQDSNCNAAVAISFRTYSDEKIKTLPGVKGEIILRLNAINPDLFPKRSKNLSEKDIVLGYSNAKLAFLAKEHIDGLLLKEFGINYSEVQCLRF